MNLIRHLFKTHRPGAADKSITKDDQHERALSLVSRPLPCETTTRRTDRLQTPSPSVFRGKRSHRRTPPSTSCTPSGSESSMKAIIGEDEVTRTSTCESNYSRGDRGGDTESGGGSRVGGIEGGGGNRGGGTESGEGGQGGGSESGAGGRGGVTEGGGGSKRTPNVVLREIKVLSNKHVAHILPGLLLGSQEIAQDLQGLKHYNVTHILNVTHEVDDRFADQFVYKRIAISDMPSIRLSDHFDEAFRFIDDCRRTKEGRVLVHCYYGNSRSASIIIAYLMRTERMRFSDALEYLQILRPLVHPNDGFERQLKEYDQLMFK